MGPTDQNAPAPTEEVWGRLAREILADRIQTYVVPKVSETQKLILQILLNRFRTDPQSGFAGGELAEELVTVSGRPSEKTTTEGTHIKRIKKAIMTYLPQYGSAIEISIGSKPYKITITGSPPSWWDKEWDYKTIGVVVANAADWFVGQVVKGFLEVLRETGMTLLIEEVTDSPRLESKRMEWIAKRTTGMLVIPSEQHFLFDAHRLVQDLPVVLVDRYIPGLAKVPFVHHDDYTAGRAVGRYLKKGGCSRVVVIHPRTSARPSQGLTPLRDREAGCRAELYEDNAVDFCPMVPLASEEQGGYDALALFDKEFTLSPNDGVFATTDKAAVGCRHYVETLSNEKRPKMEHVVGFEGQAIGDFLRPPMPSVRTDNQAVGSLAAIVLLKKIGWIKAHDSLWQDFGPPQNEDAPHYLVMPKLLLPQEAGQPRKEHTLEEYFGPEWSKIVRDAKAYYTQNTAG